jgi:hypothetical protein
MKSSKSISRVYMHEAEAYAVQLPILWELARRKCLSNTSKTLSWTASASALKVPRVDDEKLADNALPHENLPSSCCAGYLGHPFTKLDMLRVIERAFLSKHTIETYNHSGSETIVVLSFCLQRRRKVQLTFRLSIVIKQRVCFRFHALQKRFLCWVKPPTTSLVLGTLTDLVQGKSELIAENALVRQQLIILKRPVYRKADRLLLVLLARVVGTWKQALYLIQPETLLRLPS